MHQKTGVNARLLDGFYLTDGHRPLDSLLQARQQMILAYLILHDQRPQLRKRIAFLFWPDTTEIRAQANLRHALFHLRRTAPVLNDHLEITPTHVCWRNSAACHVDVIRLAAVMDALHDVHTPEEEQHLLSEAADLYTGELLPGCYEEWVLPFREHLAQTNLQVLQRLAALYQRRGDYAAALEVANRLRLADPYLESSYCQLMELHEAQGNLAAALHIYHDCATLLERELDVAPGPELQAIYARILRGGVDSPVPRLPYRSEAFLATNHLVGREAEIGEIHVQWQELLQSGGTKLVLIRGEAGIGKTHLAAEFLRAAQRQGFGTVQVRAYAAAGQLAYAPIVDWLRAEPYATALKGLDPVWLVELARLLPETLLARPDLAPPGPLTEHWQRHRFYEAMVCGIQTPNAPIVIQFDDLQWTDQETMTWLAYLLASSLSAPLMLIATVRPEEVGASHGLTPLLAQLRRNNQLHEIALGPLDRIAHTQLVTQLVETVIEPNVVESLWSYTGGNPFFVTEAIRAELTKDEHTRWQWMTPEYALEPPFSVPIPAKVHDMLHARLAQLTDTARQLAQIAAVTGQAFSVELLRQATGLESKVVLRSLDELWRLRLVEERGQHYDFRHDYIRDVTYHSISPLVRKALHLQVAAALTNLYRHDLTPISAQMAYHYERGGDLEQAVAFYLSAGRAAQRVYAETQAETLLRRGLKWSEMLPTTPDHRRQVLELCLALSAAVRVTKGWAAPDVYEIVSRAWPLAQEVGDPTQKFYVQNGLHTYHMTDGDINRAHALAKQLADLAEHQSDPQFRLAAWTIVGGSLFHMGKAQAAQHYFAACDGLYSPLLHETSIMSFGVDYGVLTLAWQSHAVWCAGYPDRALALCQDALNLADELHHPFSQTIALAYLAMLYQFRGEAAQACHTAERGLRYAKQHHIGYYDHWQEILLAWNLARKNPHGAQISRLEQCLNAMLVGGSVLRYPYYLSLLANVHVQARQVDAGLAVLDQGLAAAQRQGEHWWDAELHRLRGVLFCMQETAQADRAAAAAFDQALAIAREQNFLALELRAALGLAQFWQSQGRDVDAHALLSPLFVQFTEGFDTPDLQTAQAMLAQLA